MSAKNDVTGDAIQTKNISDEYRSNYDLIFRKEEKKSEPYVYHNQVFLVADHTSINGRVYPYDVVRNAVSKWLAEPWIYGILHSDRDYSSEVVIDLEKIAFNVSNLRLTRSGLVLGSVRIASTPRGMILREMIDAGIPMKFRIDCVATVIVQDNLQFHQFVAMKQDDTTDYSHYESIVSLENFR